MVTTPAPTWWEEQHASLCEIAVEDSETWTDAVDFEDDAQVGSAAAPHADRYRTTVLRPRRPGAQPLVLARTAPLDAGSRPARIVTE